MKRIYGKTLGRRLFDEVFDGARWHGDDAFPSTTEFRDEVESWLAFAKDAGQLERLTPRLRASRQQRDETLAEICAAYVMNRLLRFPIVGWEIKTANNRDVEFLVRVGTVDLYCEVKSPGWEGELSKSEQTGDRKKQPKYQNAEVRSVARWKSIRHAIKKSVPKFLGSKCNLVITVDDLFVSVLEAPPNNIDIALFEKQGLYEGEKGYFADDEYASVGGVLMMGYRIRSEVEYRWEFVANPNANHPLPPIPPRLDWSSIS